MEVEIIAEGGSTVGVVERLVRALDGEAAELGKRMSNIVRAEARVSSTAGQHLQEAVDSLKLDLLLFEISSNALSLRLPERPSPFFGLSLRRVVSSSPTGSSLDSSGLLRCRVRPCNFGGENRLPKLELFFNPA